MSKITNYDQSRSKIAGILAIVFGIYGTFFHLPKVVNTAIFFINLKSVKSFQI